MITIISCVYKIPINQQEDFISYISKDYPEANIILIDQTNKQFLKGQCYNIASLLVNEGILCFWDIDIKIKEILPIEEIMKVNKSIYPYTTLKETDNNIIRNNCSGGIYFITKKRYIEINGHSNLYKGYGYEDNEIRWRLQPIGRLKYVAYHSTHPKRINEEEYKVNSMIFDQIKNRDKLKKD